jgi:PiT family inorganic phosphate transporter
MAFNIGANDLANAMGTSVGSKALTVRRAIILASTLDLMGAILVGSRVTSTMRGGIVDLDSVGGGSGMTAVVIMGLLAALLAGALWITIATYWGLPVSTSHAIVGAIMGFGLAVGGVAVVKWAVMGRIVSSWIISPLAGAGMAFVVFWLIRYAVLNRQRPFAQACRITPWLSGLVFGILAISILYNAFKHIHLAVTPLQVLIISLIIAALAAIGTRQMLTRREIKGRDDYQKVERLFAFLQVATACYVAFAHGSNDVANAIGPVSGIVGQLAYGAADNVTPTAILGLLLLGGVGIAVGNITWGRRVMTTIGEKITAITPTRGFSAEFGAASTVLVCSLMGLPISTTHTLVGAVIGVGLAGGVGAVDLKVIRRIVISWLVTVPIAAITSILIFKGITLIA